MTYYLFFVIAAGALLLGLFGYFFLAAIENKQLRDDLALRRLIDEERMNLRRILPVASSSATPV